jgi:hypothetical protein
MGIANFIRATDSKAPVRSAFATAAVIAAAAALIAGCDGATIEINSDDGNTSVRSFGAGVHLTDSAKVQDVGLPLYPGAKPDKKEKSDGGSGSGGDSDSVNLSAWGGAFGFKLVVVSLESDDSPEKVAAFYQDKLAKYGTVLECNRNANGGKKKSLKLTKSDGKKRADGPITCDDATVNQEGLVYRAGTRNLQRAAAVQSRNGGSTFQLVMVEKRGLD